MTKNPTRSRVMILAALIAQFALGPDATSVGAASVSSTITVDSTDDQHDDDLRDDICETAIGTCSLRAAIATANAMLGSNTIEFDIAGTGPHRIVLTSALPTLSDRTGPVTIDGYSQPGSQPNTAETGSNAVIAIEVEALLDGDGQPDLEMLRIASPANQVRGLAVFGAEVHFLLRGEDADGNRFEGNFIGTDASGTYEAPPPPTVPDDPDTVDPTIDNGVGLLIEGTLRDGIPVGPDQNQIGVATLTGRNVIAGNGDSGIRVNFPGATDNRIQNNVIGLRPDLSDSLRQGRGVDLQFETTGNLIGGPGVLDGNLVSGHRAQTGIEFSHGATTNFAIGNLVGTLGDGNSAAAYTANNRGIAVKDGADFNWIEANVVGGNQDVGVWNKHNYTGRNYFVENRFGIGVGGAELPNLDANIDLTGHDQIWWGNLFANQTAQIRVSNRNTNPSFFADIDGPTYTHSNSVRQSQFHRSGSDAIQPLIDISPVGGNAAGWCTVTECIQDGIDSPVLTGRGPGEVYGTACASCEIEVYVSGVIGADGSIDTSGTAAGTGLAWIATVTSDVSGNFGLSDARIAQGRRVSALAVDAIGNTSELPAGRLIFGGFNGVRGMPQPSTGGIPRPTRPALPAVYDQPLPLLCEHQNGTLTWTDIAAGSYTVSALSGDETTVLGTFSTTSAAVPAADSFTVRTDSGAALRETSCDGDGAPDPVDPGPDDPDPDDPDPDNPDPDNPDPDEPGTGEEIDIDGAAHGQLVPARRLSVPAGS